MIDPILSSGQKDIHFFEFVLREFKNYAKIYCQKFSVCYNSFKDPKVHKKITKQLI